MAASPALLPRAPVLVAQSSVGLREVNEACFQLDKVLQGHLQFMSFKGIVSLHLHPKQNSLCRPFLTRKFS